MSRGSIPPPRPCSRSQLARLAPIFPRLAFRSSTPRDSSSSSWLDEGFDECNRWRSRLASSRRFPSNGEPRTSGVSFALARLGGSWGRGGDAPKGGSRGPTKFRMCNQGYGVGQKYGDFRFPDGYDLGSICGQIQTWVAHRSLPGSKEDDTAFESVWARVKKPHSTSIRFTSILQPGVVGERPPDRPQLFDHHSPGLWLCWLWGGLIIADGTLHEPRMLQGVAPQTRKSESRAKLG